MNTENNNEDIYSFIKDNLYLFKDNLKYESEENPAIEKDDLKENNAFNPDHKTLFDDFDKTIYNFSDKLTEIILSDKVNPRFKEAIKIGMTYILEDYMKKKK